MNAMYSQGFSKRLASLIVDFRAQLVLPRLIN